MVVNKKIGVRLFCSFEINSRQIPNAPGSELFGEVSDAAFISGIFRNNVVGVTLSSVTESRMNK